MHTFQIGASAAYGFAHFGVRGTFDDYLWCFRRLAELGFRKFGLEILEEDQVDIFTPERVTAFCELAASLDISVPIFTTYFLENDLVSLSVERRKKALQHFQFSIEVAEQLRSNLMNFASEFPPELVSEYRPDYVHAPGGKVWIPANISWDSLWKTQVEMVRACADMAADKGMRLSLEPRANCIISTVDSFLRLADHVNRSNFGCSLDLVHAHFNREDIPTAVKKLGSLLFDVQISDSDGQTLDHLPLGRGNIAFESIVRALEDVGFTGILGVDILDGAAAPDVDEAYRAGRIALENMLTVSTAART